VREVRNTSGKDKETPLQKTTSFAPQEKKEKRVQRPQKNSFVDAYKYIGK
jgi:hypothetical protein